MSRFTPIGRLLPLTKVDTRFIIVSKIDVIKTKDGHRIHKFIVADQTASVQLVAWDAIGELLQPADVCTLTEGFTKLFKGHMTLDISKGRIEKIDEFCFPFVEGPNLSDPFWTETKNPPQDALTCKFENTIWMRVDNHT